MTQLLTDHETTELVRDLSRGLRTPNGTMQLVATQAKALWAFTQVEGGGLLLYGRVGCGKGLLSMLLPVVAEHIERLRPERPILFVPSGLKKKTFTEFAEYAKHWQFSNRLRIEGYSLLSDRKHANFLESYQPDLLIFDESHLLSNVEKSARAKRVDRYITGVLPDGTQIDPPKVAVVCMTGSWERDSFLDYSHQLVWCLKHQCPTPLERGKQKVIASVVDADGDPAMIPKLQRMMPHVFGGCHTVTQCRAALRELLHHTPGVVITTDLYRESLLQVRPLVAVTNATIENSMARLRDHWEMPDGWALSDSGREGEDTGGGGSALGAYQAARQLSCGFYYGLDPRPPKEWLDARRGWAKAARTLIEQGRGDTEAQVRDLVISLELQPYLSAWRTWEAAQPTFIPQRKVEWLTDAVLLQCIEWGCIQPQGSVIWTVHTEFGEALANRAGWTYYGQMGMSADGRYIDKDPATQPIVASIASNSTGRNLQHQFNRGLIVGVPTSARDWEQLLGRKHRLGQKKPKVTFDYLVACTEHVQAVEKSVRLAIANEEKDGMPLKLAHCDMEMPPPLRELPQTPAYRSAQLDTHNEEGNETNGRLFSSNLKTPSKQLPEWLRSVVVSGGPSTSAIR